MQWSGLQTLAGAVRRSLAVRFRSVSRMLIEDAVQEAQYRFMQSFYNKGSTDPPLCTPAVRQWITTTATRLLLKELEHVRRHSSLSTIGNTSDEKRSIHTSQRSITHIEPAYDPRNFVDAALTIELLLPLLSPRLAEVIELHDLQGMSMDEIASRLQCSPSTVRQRHARAIRRLRSIVSRMHDRCMEGNMHGDRLCLLAENPMSSREKK